jgi:hypothetical protein
MKAEKTSRKAVRTASSSNDAASLAESSGRTSARKFLFASLSNMRSSACAVRTKWAGPHKTPLSSKMNWLIHQFSDEAAYYLTDISSSVFSDRTLCFRMRTFPSQIGFFGATYIFPRVRYI